VAGHDHAVLRRHVPGSSNLPGAMYEVVAADVEHIDAVDGRNRSTLFNPSTARSCTRAGRVFELRYALGEAARQGSRNGDSRHHERLPIGATLHVSTAFLACRVGDVGIDKPVTPLSTAARRRIIDATHAHQRATRWRAPVWAIAAMVSESKIELLRVDEDEVVARGLGNARDIGGAAEAPVSPARCHPLSRSP